jgi:hypothetical protein
MTRAVQHAGLATDGARQDALLVDLTPAAPWVPTACAHRIPVRGPYGEHSRPCAYGFVATPGGHWPYGQDCPVAVRGTGRRQCLRFA